MTTKTATATAARTLLDRSLSLAAEYAGLYARGDVVLAAQVRRTIEDLGLGRYERRPAGDPLAAINPDRWAIDARVRRAMGLR